MLSDCLLDSLCYMVLLYCLYIMVVSYYHFFLKSSVCSGEGYAAKKFENKLPQNIKLFKGYLNQLAKAT